MSRVKRACLDDGKTLWLLSFSLLSTLKTRVKSTRHNKFFPLFLRVTSLRFFVSQKRVGKKEKEEKGQQRMGEYLTAKGTQSDSTLYTRTLRVWKEWAFLLLARAIQLQLLLCAVSIIEWH